MARTGRRKPRTSKTYQRKLDKLKKWYEKRVQARKEWNKENKHGALKIKVKKPLKPLEWYIDQLRKTGEDGSKKNSVTSNVTRGSWY